MKKLLVVCGPTGAGKTGMALRLAKKLEGDILSADSRQVYRGMDIITGKDLPEGSRFRITNYKWNGKSLGYWEASHGVRFWLIDLVDAKENFSVAQWNRAAQKALRVLWKERKLPVADGGTGLYIKAIVDGIETIEIPRNEALRKRLEDKSAEELYDMLSQLDTVRAAEMNRSDRSNPRRLVRAIEVASWQVNHRLKEEKKEPEKDVLMLGITAPRKTLYSRIDKRVEMRLRQGALKEIKKLLRQGVSWEAQSMSGLGYQQLRDYFEKKISLEEAVQAWKNAEHKYARQQLTWFKKDPRIVWFDITSKDWQKKVANLVESWYSRG